jgi:hypothetical protein
MLCAACGEAPALEKSYVLDWQLAGATCRDVGGQRVELEAGGLGLIAHGPCALDAALTLVLPVGAREVRGQVFDDEERLVAVGQRALDTEAATLVLRPVQGLRGALWLWPHVGAASGCDVLGVAAYRVTLERPWGEQEQRRIPCSGSGDVWLHGVLPGTWRVQVEALGAAGTLLGAGEIVQTIAPGNDPADDDGPMVFQLIPQSGPQGPLDLRYRRHDGSLGRCEDVGVERLVLDVRPVGLDSGIQLTVPCGESLPDWRRLLARPGRLELLAQAYQGARIYYAGSWSLLLVPGGVNPALILEPQ